MYKIINKVTQKEKLKIISKSSYILGQQCEKSFWFKHNQYPETNPQDEAAQERLAAGDEVGEISKMLFPEGEEIPFLDGNYQDMHDITMEKISLGAERLYEASFLIDGIFIRVDLMNKTKDGWDIYEVKSSSSVKDYHKDDASLQWHVLKKIPEIKLNSLYVAVLNNAYEKSSEIIPDEFFKKENVTEIANQNRKAVEQKISELKILSSQNDKPKIKISSHCKKPHDCVYQDNCWPKNKDDLNSIFTLYRLNTKKKIDLYEMGIDTFEKIQDESGFTNIQQKQLQAYKIKQPIIDKKVIREFIEKVQYPISYFDFETFSDAVPVFERQKPHMQVPFQYSLHIQSNIEEKLKIDEGHYEFLANHEIDPRRSIAESMIKHLPAQGTIMAYNESFEKKCIKSLAEHCPDLADQLLSFNERFLDLIIPFRSGGYYDLNFKGSFSLKNVLPALCPENKELDYDNLEISDGGTASSTFKKMQSLSEDEIKIKRNNLREYCRLDTYAMYAIYAKLLEI